MSRAETATIQLYENTRVRDELTDTAAEPLLLWGEALVVRLDAQFPDDEAFDAQYTHLRKLMIQINRFVGKRAADSPEEHAERWQRVMEHTDALGQPIAQDARDSFWARHESLSDLETITTLIALIDAEAAAAAQAEVTLSDPAAAPTDLGEPTSAETSTDLPDQTDPDTGENPDAS
ncbi:MAG: hypothetical protein GYB67_15130 [Chloroflexi bacterium]|nr:hypothetical protein [Chloroflexota bacterium]